MCVAPVRPGWWWQPRYTRLGCAIKSEGTALQGKCSPTRFVMEAGLHFAGGEAVTLSEEALISATEINPASDADLKALTPKAQTPSVLFWVLLQVLLPWLLTPQACVTQPCNQNTCALCCSILSHRDSREKCFICRESEQHHLFSF